MRSQQVWLAALVGLAACGDNIGMFGSGSRLTAVIESAGKDSDVLAYFRDRERSVECTFQPDREGGWRCLPRHTAHVAGYVDRDCTQPIYRCPTCGADDDQASVLVDGCTDPIAVPHALANTEAPTFFLAGNLCANVVLPPDRYVTATPLDDAAFAEAHAEDHQVADGLGARWLATDDGAHQLHGGYLLADGRSCTFLGGPGKPHPCLPGTPARVARGLTYYFDSDTCTSRLAHVDGPAHCAAPSHVALDNSVRLLGDPVSTPVFELSPIDSSCTATASTLPFFAIGALDPSLPQAAVIALGDGPAQPVYYAAGGSPLEFTGRWLDLDGQTCIPFDTVSAGRRCVPRAVALLPSSRRWADPACTTELVFNPDDHNVGIVWEGVTVATSLDAASVVGEVRQLRRYPGIQVFGGGPGQCTLLPEDAVLMSYVEGPVDTAGFPAITVQ